MKWAALLYQEGGCDYTIGCGRLWQFFNADSKDAALKRVREIRANYGSDRISEITLIKIAEDNGKPCVEKIDLKSWDKEDEDETERLNQEEIEKKERSDLERLKEKYKE